VFGVFGENLLYMKRERMGGIRDMRAESSANARWLEQVHEGNAHAGSRDSIRQIRCILQMRQILKGRTAE
jgi:hypothetical protein